jgi:hypothetical protein
MTDHRHVIAARHHTKRTKSLTKRRQSVRSSEAIPAGKSIEQVLTGNHF